ncbi:MAG: GNAT family N-acetyltransferase [Anaerolineaceae bacterium]|nr:GNAT family N-acetyltransferase [Anaerolineaceae bacterium]
MQIITKEPIICTSDDLEHFESLVKLGNEVDLKRLRNRIFSAKWLLFLYEEDNKLAGISAIKQPKEKYKKEIFSKSKSGENPEIFQYEVGWVYVKEQYRRKGYSTELLNKIVELSNGGPLFATTKESNTPMKKTLLKFGFQESGETYPSKRGDYKLILYLRNKGKS